MLVIKPGVRLFGLRAEIILALMAADAILAELGHDCVVTAAMDGKHSNGSLHYSGAAVDLRTRDLTPEDLKKFESRLRECLGGDFDVVVESTHLHLEFQPKRALTSP